MTTNKPEVVAYSWQCHGRHSTVDKKFADELVADGERVDPLIRLSDYEALQAECEALKKQIEELREAQLSDRERECLHIGRAVERAAAELPVGYELRIELERDAGSVRLFDDMSEEIEIDADGPFSDQINSAIEAAIAKEMEE